MSTHPWLSVGLLVIASAAPSMPSPEESSQPPPDITRPVPGGAAGYAGSPETAMPAGPAGSAETAMPAGSAGSAETAMPAGSAETAMPAGPAEYAETAMPAGPAGTWVKLSPLDGAPVSPRLGYEGDCVWESWRRVLLRYGGHNQGGGGEQHSEVWTFDPLTARWALKEPNTSPPGVCCAQQNVFDPVGGRYLRFPAFSGSHGWQWWREIYLNDSSVWSYDLAMNIWRNLCPLPAPSPRPLRATSWDSDFQVAVIFGGENSHEGTLVYDPHANAWTRMDPSPQPELRSGGNMAYDAARRAHVLFGSQFDDDRHTWTYDLAKNEWRDMRPPSMPPTDKNDAVLTYDPIRRAVIAVVKITTGEDESAKHRLETWTYDAGSNRWTRLAPEREPDPTGNRARVLAFAPELGFAILENRTHPPHGPPEQQIWTLRLSGDGAEVLLPPADLKVATEKEAAVLSWKPSPSPGVTGYEVCRRIGAEPWKARWEKVRRLGAGEISYRDEGLRRGTVYFYSVWAVGMGSAESTSRAAARTQPRFVEDAVVSVLSAREVEVSWKASAEPDVVGYVVERAAVRVLTEDQLRRLKRATPPLAEPSVGIVEEIGPFLRLTRSPIAATRFTDVSVDLGRPEPIEGEPVYQRELYEDHLDRNGEPYRLAVHAYRIRAVNALGVESGPSPAFLTIPSAPRHLFSREAGTTCQLKWAASPEKGIAGYRVYRMDGRYDDAKIQRLMAEPIIETQYTDPGAGGDTRRYYVVAVDALGQEGFPSSPVWFDREWKQFYVPFVGEWHQ